MRNRRTGRSRSKERIELCHRAIEPLERRAREKLPVREVAVCGVDAGRQGRRLEEAEERPQVMLDHQSVTVPTAGRGEQHRLACERGGVEKVEEMLEESGIASLVDGARDDQRVGSKDRIHHRPSPGREIVQLRRGSERRTEVVQVERLSRPARTLNLGARHSQIHQSPRT